MELAPFGAEPVKKWANSVPRGGSEVFRMSKLRLKTAQSDNDNAAPINIHFSFGNSGRFEQFVDVT